MAGSMLTKWGFNCFGIWFCGMGLSENSPRQPRPKTPMQYHHVDSFSPKMKIWQAWGNPRFLDKRTWRNCVVNHGVLGYPSLKHATWCYPTSNNKQIITNWFRVGFFSPPTGCQSPPESSIIDAWISPKWSLTLDHHRLTWVQGSLWFSSLTEDHLPTLPHGLGPFRAPPPGLRVPRAT